MDAMNSGESAEFDSSVRPERRQSGPPLARFNVGLNKWALMHTGVNRARRRAADAKARRAKRRAKRLAGIKAARAARKVA